MAGVTLVGLAEIRAAAGRLAGVAVRTPLLAAPWSNGAGPLLLKPESLQPTGAFKLRGAYAAATAGSLRIGTGAPGLVTHSSGNHGRALAYAARTLGLPCLVVMPEQAAPHKIAATRAAGAEVVLVPPGEREARAAALAAEHGYRVVPPYDDPAVIAGQGTVGLEIVEDLPEVEVVLVPVGGGGLASGVATAVAALRPGARVVGVEPALAADAAESLAAGERRVWPVAETSRTVADGLRTALSELTFAHLRARLEGVVTVTEEEILDAAGRLLREAGLVAEPSGAVATAAFLHRRADLPSGRTVAIISGGNVGAEQLRRLATPDRPAR